MTRMKAVEMAAEMVASKTTSVIIQKGDKKDVVVFKFHKLECPNCQVSLAINGKIEKDMIVELSEAFPLLVDAVEMLS
jgi:hypothetical protein